MHWKSLRLAALAILALVLAVTPFLIGCGEKEPAEKKVITIGTLADFSGIAAAAVVPTVDAFEDAILYYQEKAPIRGVDFRFVHYDHQLNYAKSRQGYEDLKAQDMQIFYAMGGTELEALRHFVAEDGIPTIGSYGTTGTLIAPWIYFMTPTQTWGTEACLEWIKDTWDYSKGAPKIGHQGWGLSTTEEVQEGIDNVLSDPAYAGQFNWKGQDKAITGTAAWSAQVEKFKDCDYVFVSIVGNSLATFVNQMRALGYKGAFVSNANQFTGYWPAVQGATAAAELYGCYYCWWGPIMGSDDPADWFQTMIATTKAKYDDWAVRLNSTGPISGWATGYVVYNAVANAVEHAGGSDKVDSAALKGGFDSLQIDVEGVGETFRFSDTNACGLTSHKIVQWDVATGKWTDTNGVWYEPITLPE